MALLTPRRPKTRAPRHGDDVGPEPSRVAQWWASWRVAVRLARRDVRRHRGRNALIMVMVGLPVAVLVAGTTLWATDQLGVRERIPYVMGTSQALLTPGASTHVMQTSEGRIAGVDKSPATPVPGWAPGSEVAALDRLTGGHVSPVNGTSLRVRLGTQKVVSASVLGIDVLQTRGAAGIVSLSSGHWPTAEKEVVVTPTGLSKGLPSSGTVYAVGADGASTAYTVVGVGSGWRSSYGEPQAVDLIALPRLVAAVAPAGGGGGDGLGDTSYLLDRATPVTWAEVRDLNAQGVLVVSREVIENPPPASDVAVPPDSVSAAGDFATVGMLAVALLMLTTLLAGPAFAVSAARQRRTLALAASNGATRAQLRRTVLGQAVVLGALSAVLGGVVGVVAAAVGQRLGNSYKPWRLFGPFDIPWLQVALVVGAAVVSSVVASLLPARGLGRLDVVAAIRGLTAAQPVRRRVPWIGLALLAVGSAATLYAGLSIDRLDGNTQGWVMVGGSVVLVVGSLFVVPLILLVVSRASARLPFWVRMATRESARQRGRATATVAAVLGGSAVLAAALVATTSQDAFNAKHYQPSIEMGTGSIFPANSRGPSGDPALLGQVQDLVQRVAPSLQLTAYGRVDFPENWQEVSRGARSSVPVTHQLAAVRVGCPVEALVEVQDLMSDQRCASVGAGVVPSKGIETVTVADLRRLLSLNDQQAAAAQAGAIVVPQGAPGTPALPNDGRPRAPVDVVNGAVTFATLRVDNTRADGSPSVSVERRQQVPAVVVDRPVLESAFRGSDVGAVLTPEAAAALGWQTIPDRFALRAPSGPISEADRQRLEAAVQDEFGDGSVYVERGYQRSDALVIGVGLGLVSLIILIATLIATVLSQTEAGPLMGTLAAVGATRGTRRAWAGASAASLALVGALVGILVGLVPGIALAVTLTSSSWVNGQRVTTAPTLSFPWLPLLVVVIVVPAAAGAIAWSSIRRAPTVTRRTG